MLPLGTTREFQEQYEEVTIPPARPVPPKTYERLIPVSDLDPLAAGSFPVGSCVLPLTIERRSSCVVWS